MAQIASTGILSIVSKIAIPAIAFVLGGALAALVLFLLKKKK